MKPKSGVYSLISRLTSVPSAIPIAPSAASDEDQVADAPAEPSDRGEQRRRRRRPAPMKLSRKSVPIVGTTEK